ncbi:MAG: hypothetical protein ACRD0B_11190, partial [Acidimicrobiales bacterium]
MSPGCCCESNGRTSGPRSREAVAIGSLYERVGGDEWFVTLVDRFYDGVENDPVLRPLYPADLVSPRRHLAMFLAQYFGGPPDYNADRGHPR